MRAYKVNLIYQSNDLYVVYRRLKLSPKKMKENQKQNKNKT